jgi:hypothetical protein
MLFPIGLHQTQWRNTMVGSSSGGFDFSAEMAIVGNVVVSKGKSGRKTDEKMK